MAQLSAVANVAVPTIPVGSLQSYAGPNAPYGWLLCDGSAVSRTQYPDLYSALGTAYGSGNGSTTFNIPDMRGRMPVGKGTHSDVATLGNNDGVAVANRRPKHQHTVYDPGHVHDETMPLATGGGVAANPGVYLSANWTNSIPASTSWSGGLNTASNTTGVKVNPEGTASSSAPTDAPGYLVTNYIIKALSDTPRNGLYANPAVPIVTSLPTNPAFGDVVTYIADATNGVAWNLQYDASGTYPWKFIGGPPLNANAYTSAFTTSGTSWQTTSTSVALPLPGDYDLTFGGHANGANATTAGLSPNCTGITAPNGTTGAANSSGAFAYIAANTGEQIASTYRAVGISGTLALYAQSAVAVTIFRPYITATPVRVKAA